MKNLKLKAARAGLDMSQADLAEAVGVSRQTISAIEKGTGLSEAVRRFIICICTVCRICYKLRMKSN